MTKRLLVVSVVGIAALLSVASGVGGQVPSNSAPPATGLIVGQVVDATTMRGVPEAVVTLTAGSGGAAVSALGRGGAAAQRLLADANGRFVFRGLAGGRYTLLATQAGYLTGLFGKLTPRGQGSPIELAGGERLLDARVLIWKHAAITGRVLDESGEPIVLADVRVLRLLTSGGKVEYRNVGGALTDDRGVYRVGALAPGSYLVHAAATSTSLPAQMIDEFMRSSGDARAEMQQALFQAAPSMSSAGGESNQQVGSHILQVGGRMPLPPAPIPGGAIFVYTTTFYPRATGPTTANAIVVAAGETRAGIDLQLRPVPTARVSGRLEGASGPVGIAALFLIAASAGGSEQSMADAAATTVADANGAFTFLGVPAGQYHVRVIKWARSETVSAPGVVIQTPSGTVARGGVAAGPAGPSIPTQWAEQSLTVGDRDVSDVRVRMQTGLRVSGKVVVEGTPPNVPIQRLQVLIEPVAGWLSPAPEASLNEKGEFASVGLPTGRYRISLPTPDGWYVKSITVRGQDASLLPIDVTGEIDDLTITLREGGVAFTGMVRDRQGRPDVTASVLAFPVDPREWVDFGAYPRRIREARTGRDGRYTLSDLPAGEYLIVAAHQSAMDWSMPRFLETLSRVASRVTLGDGESRTMDLRTVEVR